MKKTLYLMRHGQTLFNTQHRIQGWCDSPLTPLGIAQAHLAGENLAKLGIVWDHAYSSTSERCCDTLEQVTSMPYTRLKGLKEWNFGTIEGMPERLNPPVPYGDFFKTYYQGEGEKEMQVRISSTIQQIMDQPDHNSVLMVSHGGCMFGFVRYFGLEKSFPADTIMTNCSTMVFEYENGVFTIKNVITPDFSTLQG